MSEVRGERNPCTTQDIKPDWTPLHVLATLRAGSESAGKFCSDLRINRRGESVGWVPWPHDAPDWLAAADEKEQAGLAWSWWEQRLGDFDLRPTFAGGRLIAIEGYVGDECRASGLRKPGEDLNALLHDVASDVAKRASMPDA